jgi:hypothetical protein
VILADTDVLLDLVTDDPVWAQWSFAQFESAAIQGPLLINDVVYAEPAARCDTIEHLDAFVAAAELILYPPAEVCTLSRRQGVHAISERWRAAKRYLPGFLHWRPCNRPRPSHAR